jgi:hypothetical protein
MEKMCFEFVNVLKSIIKYFVENTNMSYCDFGVDAGIGGRWQRQVKKKKIFSRTYYNRTAVFEKHGGWTEFDGDES